MSLTKTAPLQARGEGFPYESRRKELDLEKMSISEKVGQTMITYFRGKEVDAEAERLIRDYKVGGIILYTWANDLKTTTPSQVKDLNESLQTLAHQNSLPPLFISIDEEAGAIRRLGDGFTEFPGNAALGRTQNPNLAYSAALAMGEELKEVGINMNFAPVVDVHSNTTNWVIGIRSFGSNAKNVTLFGEKALEGYLASGIIPCLKHYPGHGDVSCDPHFILPVVNRSMEQLYSVELYPFKHLARLTPAIMTAHIRFSQIDASNCATLSSFFLNDILRRECAYEGVAITDSLTMKGVLEDNKLEHVAIAAFMAGNDILLFGGRNLDDADEDKKNHIEEIGRVHQALVEAVESGLIDEDRLNRSVARILKLKERIALFDEGSSSLPKEMKREQNLALAKQIASLSIEVKQGTLPKIKKKKIALLISDQLENVIKSTDFMKIADEKSIYYFTEKEFSKEQFAPLLTTIEEIDQVFFFSSEAKHPKWIDQIGEQKPLIYVSVKNYSPLVNYDNASVVIITHSPSKCVFQALYEKLEGGNS